MTPALPAPNSGERSVAVGRWERVAWLLARCACYPGRCTVVLAAAVFGVSLSGTYLVFQSYALTRDEAMAEFDATIIGGGHLVENIPALWRPFAHALEPSFVLPIKDNAGWVSNYLPINAALRAFFALAGSATLTGPILAALALIALIAIARRLWPSRPDAAIVAGLMLASSTQVLVTAMTPYAMTAHLAFNLVWLWLFLRDTTASRVGAVAVGFFATGLHQLVFHPLFVMPFVACLWWRRRTGLALFYTSSYAVICLIWIAYWHIMLNASGLEASPTHPHSFFATVADLIANARPENSAVMSMNLARFVAWQNPLLLPLALIAAWGLRRWSDTVGALAAGIVLTIASVSVVLAFQGHGWGYRYLHGLIGSFALIATQAYVEFTRSDDKASTRRVQGMVTASASFAIAVMLPLRCLEARAFVTPYAVASRDVHARPGDVVLVDRDGMAYLKDIVRNAPDLSNRPLVFDLLALDRDQIRALCRSHDVAVFDQADGEALGLAFFSNDRSDDSLSRRALMTSLACGHPLNGHR